jgi:hypothetical protein
MEQPEHPLPSLDDIREVLTAIGASLAADDYAIIGGAALIGMGMELRTTVDVDILVRTGQTVSIKNRLAAVPHFVLDRRTRRLTYDGGSGTPVEIDVLNTGLARIPFEDGFPIFFIAEGAKLASATVLLNYKLSSIYSRSTEAKKLTDLQDISFLIGYDVKNGMQLELGTCPNATVEAFRDLTNRDAAIDEEDWKFIGGLME